MQENAKCYMVVTVFKVAKYQRRHESQQCKKRRMVHQMHERKNYRSNYIGDRKRKEAGKLFCFCMQILLNDTSKEQLFCHRIKKEKKKKGFKIKQKPKNINSLLL